ncbi:MAG TPA: hypothetical protein VFH54_09105 [Mycobacteriales bacterium]|nr:hypothetical protein [Mycobacteriales bacterium]
MNCRNAMLRRVAWTVSGLSVVALVLAGLAGITLDRSLHVQQLAVSDIGWWISYFIFSIVGGLVAARRPDHRIGWLMLIAGAVNALAEASSQYAIWGLARHPGSLPGAAFASWVFSFSWTPAITTLLLVLAYFPNGRLASPRWRWLPCVAVAITAIIVGTSAVDLWPRRGPKLLSDNSDLLQSTWSGRVIGVLWPFVLICAIGGMLSIGLRWRRARGIERQQLKWLVLAGGISAPMIIVGELLRPSSSFYTTAQLLNSPTLIGAAIALAVLRFRLYDIDHIVSRTVTYAVVTGVVVGVYVVVVGTVDAILGAQSSVAVAASTLVAAAVFQPARSRVQRAVDRRFNRSAYDARRTVEDFSARLREQVDVGHVNADLVATVEQAVQPATVSVWMASA